MENWGLTTYRESALLYDSEKSSVSSKLGITMVVAHELAHQVNCSLFFRYEIEGYILIIWTTIPSEIREVTSVDCCIVTFI